MNDSKSASVRVPTLFRTVLLAASMVLTSQALHAYQGDCGQPVTDGPTPTAADALHILKTAVGSQTCAPDCICNVDDTGEVTAQDALLCLKKAVGQNVTLYCGPACGAPPDTVEMIVGTKNQGSYSTSDLQGTWDLHSIATGPGAPYWLRGYLNIQSNGSSSGSLSDSDGDNINISGKLALSSGGVLTCIKDCPIKFEGSMDSGKTVMAVNSVWDDGSTDIMLMTKRAGSYSQSDLAGTWHVNLMSSSSASPGWARGTVTIQNDGTAAGEVTLSDGSQEMIGGKFKLSSSGAITCTSGCDPGLRGALDAGKDFAAAAFTDDSNDALLLVLDRKGGSYSQSDLTGNWRINTLASGLQAPWWDRGLVTIQSNGNLSGTLTASDGSSEDASATFTLGADGVVTGAGDPALRCAVDADKTVFVCTNSWY